MKHAPVLSIAIAGGRGAGKSTALRLCGAALRTGGWHVVELDDYIATPAGISADMAEARSAAAGKPIAVLSTRQLAP